jgi:DNA-binding transcriptional LysR family regulator
MADRRLQVFQTVARLLSFTKAAEELHMTQPAVTFQVRQLEEQFNTRLFDRIHNRISLTDAGKRVHECAERIFELYAEMDNSVRELTGDISGVLILGASTTIAEYMLPVLLGDFKVKYPDITIRLKVANTDGIVSQVENNTIDLGVVEASVNNKNLVVEKCRTDHLVLIVPPGHELAKEEVVPIKRVADYPFICREEGSGTREVMIESMHDAGVSTSDLNIVMELGSLEAIKGAVESGMGVSILSNATIQNEL